MEPALFPHLQATSHHKAVLNVGSKKSLFGLGWMAASRQGLGFPLVAADNTVGCTEALMTGRSASQEELAQGPRLLRPLHLLPDPAATHILPAFLRVPWVDWQSTLS